MSNHPRRPIILVVDDTPENIDILKGALSHDYSVKAAINGQTALKIAAAKPHPDLILLDIMMPGMDGYQVCRQLKENLDTKSIPVIFVTAMSKDADELQGLNLGAVDYITKPFSIPIVVARVKTQLALQEAYRKLDQHNQTLLQERHLIESIILKMRQADVVDQRHLRFLIAPVEQTAGDMLLATFTPDGRQLVLLGDFTGHGLPAAIGGPLVTYILHDLARRGATAADILDTINRQLCARLPTGIFFAAALLEITADRSRAWLWNAGLPECLLLRRGGVVLSLPSLLPPLGIIPSLGTADADAALTLHPGDRCYICSDGIVEAASPQGELFGIDRLTLFLQQASMNQRPLDDLVLQLAAYTNSAVFEDDITLVEITC
ncbi:MAG: SpoIIE family protein phosphatase [Magnetococcales bacterium]|nr:SpoIIE family protein phosphatase [Magnetococcales bacterium]